MIKELEIRFKDKSSLNVEYLTDEENDTYHFRFTYIKGGLFENIPAHTTLVNETNDCYYSKNKLEYYYVENTPLLDNLKEVLKIFNLSDYTYTKLEIWNTYNFELTKDFELKFNYTDYNITDIENIYFIRKFEE